MKIICHKTEETILNFSIMLTFAGKKKNAMFFCKKDPLSSSWQGFIALHRSNIKSINIAIILPGKVKGSNDEIKSPARHMEKITASCKRIFITSVYQKADFYSGYLYLFL